MTVHIVLDDFDKLGRAYRETDDEKADLEAIVSNMQVGEYKKPVRVIAFNTSEFWSRQASGQGLAYSGLKMPVVIVARADDRVVDPEALTLEIRHALLKKRLDQGHMVHQTSTAEILSLIYTAEEESARLSPPARQREAREMSTSSRLRS